MLATKAHQVSHDHDQDIDMEHLKFPDHGGYDTDWSDRP